MTRAGKRIIGILLVVLAIVWIVPENLPPKGENSAELTKTAENRVTKLSEENFAKAATIERSANGYIAINGLAVAKVNTEIRNPFTYQHETGNEKIALTQQAMYKPKQSLPGKTVANADVKTTPQVKTSRQWELNGIIVSEEFKQAILSKGDKIVTLNPGDSFDGNKVVDITKSELIYEGQNGKVSLKLPGP